MFQGKRQRIYTTSWFLEICVYVLGINLYKLIHTCHEPPKRKKKKQQQQFRKDTTLKNDTKLETTTQPTNEIHYKTTIHWIN